MEAGDGVAGGGLDWPARDGRRRGGPTCIKAAVLGPLLREEEDLPEAWARDLAGGLSSGRLRRRM